MDQVFRAGRAIGRATVLRELGKKGSKYLIEAVSALRLSRIRGLSDEADELHRVASNWKQLVSRLPAINARIQAEDPRTNQAFSCGIWLGMAIEGCYTVAQDSDLPTSKSRVIESLEKGKEHARALKYQRFVPNMKDFAPDFDRLIFAVNTIGNTTASPLGEFQRAGHLILNLSNQVGNAI